MAHSEINIYNQVLNLALTQTRRVLIEKMPIRITLKFRRPGWWYHEYSSGLIRLNRDEKIFFEVRNCTDNDIDSIDEMNEGIAMFDISELYKVTTGEHKGAIIAKVDCETYKR